MKPTKSEKKLEPGIHIHLIGIGGSGLSAIAELLIGRGFKVSGSDLQTNDRTEALISKGATIYRGHDANNIDGADLVLISSAIPGDNEELHAAVKRGLTVLKRDSFLQLLTKDKLTIAVAGSHGKTTTTGMITQIMRSAQLDPSYIVGGLITENETNGFSGNGDYFVIEADEYDYMFLGLNPFVAVITNVEYDHPDLFKTRDIYLEAFRTFANQVRPDGVLILCADDKGASHLISGVDYRGTKKITYGIGSGDWQAKDLQVNQLGGTDFVATKNNEVVGLARLRVPGKHNVLNGLAAIAVSSELGISFNVMRKALAEFGGIGRRFQIIGSIADVTVVDDYAHHPTEIRVTLSAAKERFPGRRLWAVWQPHTFSRTKKFESEFATCFLDADRLVALDIYRSRENDVLGIDTLSILKSIEGPQRDYLPDVEQAAHFILDRIQPGDVVLTLSAGDGNRVGEIILSQLSERLSNGNSIRNGQ
jgi:UDP-N-acetylmuramate--alanine ligase